MIAFFTESIGIRDDIFLVRATPTCRKWRLPR